jgi:uncharacterized protein YjbI with pentapeptide repeats
MNDRQLSQVSTQGDKNFRNQSLQGRSFEGKDLAGADFTGADIRGANFRNAILRNASFNNARAGLQLYQTAFFTVLLLIASGLLGVLAGFIGATIGLQFHTNALEISAKVLALVVHIGFLLIALRKGITAGFSVFAFAFAVAFAGALIHSAAIPVAGAIAIAIMIDFSVASLTMIAAAGTIVAWRAINLKVSVAVGIAFGIAFVLTLWQTYTAVSALLIISTATVLSGYVAWRTLRKLESMQRLGTTLFARWGTSFRGADLTGADFSQATLKNTDFKRANLNSIRWREYSTIDTFNNWEF